HLHDTPPYPFTPSPTFAHSSQRRLRPVSTTSSLPTCAPCVRLAIRTVFNGQLRCGKARLRPVSTTSSLPTCAPCVRLAIRTVFNGQLRCGKAAPAGG